VSAAAAEGNIITAQSSIVRALAAVCFD
jgi:hypothetical protein